VQGILQRNRLHGAPVMDDARLVGVITESDVTRAGGPSDQVKAGDAMTPNPVTVTPSTAVSDALERMAAVGVGRLLIVAEDDPQRLLGVFKRDDVVTSYHRALSARSQAVRSIDREKLITEGEAGFFDIQIPEGSIADGRPVSEIPWPEGCLVVSIHRGSGMVVPTGQTVLKSGDAVTAFGSREAEKRMVQRLAMSPENGDDAEEAG
jgi:CBS domain-containing protein